MTDRFNLLIVNPAAGKGRTVKLAEKFTAVFQKRGENYRISHTCSPGHASEIVKENLSRKNLFIYSIGGDGTLNEVVNGAVNTEAAVINIPAGSGNDFIKTVSSLRDPFEILEKSFSSEISRIDTMTVNSRYCVNIASAGFDAVVAYNTNYFKKLPMVGGSLAYVLGIFKSFAGFNFYNLKITADSEVYTGEYLLAAAANGRYYGGGIKAAPRALTDDGLIDLYMVNKIKRSRIVFLLDKYRKGLHENLKEITFARCRNILIESDKPMKINIDGEIIESSTADIRIMPKSLKMAGL